jgi:DNA recombination protein RmuC
VFEALDDIGRHLDKSREVWDVARKRLVTGRGNLVKRTQELKKLGAKTKKSMPDNVLSIADISDD